MSSNLIESIDQPDSRSNNSIRFVKDANKKHGFVTKDVGDYYSDDDVEINDDVIDNGIDVGNRSSNRDGTRFNSSNSGAKIASSDGNFSETKNISCKVDDFSKSLSGKRDTNGDINRNFSGLNKNMIGEVNEECDDDENNIMNRLSSNEKLTAFDLKQLQEKHRSIHQSYLRELCILKSKYEKMYAPLYLQRRERLLGPDYLKNKSLVKGTPELPEFWLECFRRNTVLCEMITSADEDVLRQLQDIEYCWTDETKQDSFKLIFTFSENNGYFTPSILEKTYTLTSADDNSNNINDDKCGANSSLNYNDDAILVSTEATEINWLPGKNVTKKMIKKTQQNKKTKQKRVVTQTVDVESFFNFFRNHEIPTEEQLQTMDQQEIEELEETLEVDFAAGVIIRDKIIPHAISWFLGEIDDDDDDDDNDDVDDDEENDDDDEDYESGEELDDDDDDKPNDDDNPSDETSSDNDSKPYSRRSREQVSHHTSSKQQKGIHKRTSASKPPDKGVRKY